MKSNKRKIGRNEPCPCGSGKKYKKCHGIVNRMNKEASFPFNHADIEKRLKQKEAKEIQRIQQQGLGRPIISTVYEGYRLVFVGNRCCWNKEEEWKTFPSFLDTYLIQLFGEKWGKAELKKNLKERHPVIHWQDHVCKERKKVSKQEREGKIVDTPVTGAMFAYLTLAYNLYLIAHNIHLVHGQGLHKRLIKRLKKHESFYPAFYETMVAASFIKAGFQIELEDEGDSSADHAEFVAISQKTKIKYSVEAKHRQAGKSHTGISKQLYNALKKDLPYKRVIFINLNIPENILVDGRMKWLHDVIHQMRQGENDITIGKKSAPEAYVFVTNHPFLYNLGSFTFPPAAVAEGFKIPDFKIDSAFRNLREALNSRERHIDMLDLMKAMKEYDQIPQTFTGEIPEYAFGEIQETRLIIGNKYLIPDSLGNDVLGELVDCVVSEKKKEVICVHKLEEGTQTIGSYQLTDKELEAYSQHPDTFFGVYKKQSRQAKDALDLYDFFFESYSKSTKEKLLEFLKGSPDYSSLKDKTQKELAEIYCERLVYSAMRKTKKKKNVEENPPTAGVGAK